MWYLISPPLPNHVLSANFPHLSCAANPQVLLHSVGRQQSKTIQFLDKCFQGFCVCVWPQLSCFKGCVYGPWPHPGCCARHAAHSSCCHMSLKMFFHQIPPQLGAFGLSQFSASGMLASVGVGEGGFVRMCPCMCVYVHVCLLLIVSRFKCVVRWVSEFMGGICKHFHWLMKNGVDTVHHRWQKLSALM